MTVTTALGLVWLPWAFGGVDPWAQGVAAALTTLGFAAALRPRSRRAAGSPARALLRFPVFWAGLALFAYVAGQQLNPAYVHRVLGHEWWLEAQPCIGWLPAGMTVPFADAGPLRTLLLWYPPWAAACALWIGATRRVVVITLLNVVAANGFVLAAFGLVQLAAGRNSIYGIRSAPSAEIFASFIYRNHAAAYFNLVLAVVIALALHTLRRRSGAGGHGPAILYCLFALTALAAVVLSFSLAGAVLLLAGGTLLAGVTLVRFRREIARRPIRWISVVAALVLAGAVGTFAAASGGTPLREHLRIKLEGGARQSLRSRLLADRRGLEMFGDRPLLGWGAGCFRYGFTKYQHRELEITGTGLARHFWEHLHNDWLEILIELGVIGAAPLVVVLAAAGGFLVRRRFWRQPFLLWGVAGLGVLGVHALIDFPLQNPAVLFTASCVLGLLARWSQLAAGNGPDPAS